MVHCHCWWRACSISIVTHKVGGFIEWVAHLPVIRISEVYEIYWVHMDLSCKSSISWRLTVLANMNFLFGVYRLVNIFFKHVYKCTVLLPFKEIIFMRFTVVGPSERKSLHVWVVSFWPRTLHIVLSLWIRGGKTEVIAMYNKKTNISQSFH